MNSFFADLKHAREASGISLAEISDATLISMKLLEALENGNDTVVPQAYLRAFIREYAAVVGLDRDETMKKYDAWQKGKEALPQTAKAKQEPKPAAQPEISPGAAKETGIDKLRQLMPTLFKIGIAVVVLILIDI
ncbi:MAG: helix-turn-helix domain-containing protein, partial [Ignavibacteriae bacterium]|nr:helix-turn-helix domain-containing protein [Ignavibacteriota bacterium]